MIEHKAPISGIAAYANRYVATAGYDNQVILWDAKSKTSVARALHDHLANQCEFSANGRWLASSSSDYSARIWDVPSMRLKTVLTDHEDDVEGLAFHASRAWIATGSRDSKIRVFDLDGRLLKVMSGHAADVLSVGWLGQSDTLISSSDDGTIKRWDALRGDLVDDIDMGGVETDTIAMTPDGCIFAGNDEGQVIVIDGPTKQVVSAHNAGIKRVVYDKSTKRLTTLSYDRNVKFWNVSNSNALELLHSASLPAVVWPRSCAFLNDDEVVFVTFGSGYAVYNYKTATWNFDGVKATDGVNGASLRGGEVYTVGDAGLVKKHHDVVAELGSLCNFIVPFGSRLLAGGQMGAVLDAETGQCYHQHRSPLNCAVTFEYERKATIIIGSYTGEAVLLELVDGAPVYVHDIKLHDNAIKGMAVSGDTLFSVCATGSASFHALGSYDLLARHSHAHDKIANGCAAIDDVGFVSVSRDKKLRIWKDRQSKCFDTPHGNSIKCCAVSASGEYVATGDYAGHVGLFHIPSGEYVNWYRLTAAGISSLLAGQHGEHSFLATSYDGGVYPVLAVPRLARKAG